MVSKGSNDKKSEHAVDVVYEAAHEATNDDGWIYAVMEDANIDSELLIDSGAHVSVCTEAFARHVMREPLDQDLSLKSVTGAALDTKGQRRVRLELWTTTGEKIHLVISFVVADVSKNILATADLTYRGCRIIFDERPHVEIMGRIVYLMRSGKKFMLPTRFPRDVGGNLVADVDGSSQRCPPLLEKPDEMTQAAHVLTHIPFANWCRSCVMGRAPDEPHRRHGDRSEEATPVVVMDYGFMGLSEVDSEVVTMLVMKDTRSGMTSASLLREKGPDEFSVRAVTSFIEELGYLHLFVQTDGEPAIKALAAAVKSELARKSGVEQVILRNSPPGSHASNGATENTVKIVAGLSRTLREHLTEKTGLKITTQSAILPWMVRHAAYLQGRIARKQINGRTAYEDLKLTKFKGTLLELGESVIARQAGEHSAKLQSHWFEGVWLGRTTSTDEHIIGTPTGIKLARAVRRTPGQWDAKMITAMVWTPWATDESSHPEPGVAMEQTGPTHGCLACEEELTPERRKGSPRKHTPACLQRRADIRRQAWVPPPGLPPMAPPALVRFHTEKAQAEIRTASSSTEGPTNRSRSRSEKH